jgi:hypothetical protein
MKPDSSGTPDRQGDELPDGMGRGVPDDPLGRYGAAGSEPPSTPAEGEEPGTEEMVPEYADTNVQNRLWLKAVVPLLQLRSHETDPSGRVQFAFDLMYIAACERVARILRSDLPSN